MAEFRQRNRGERGIAPDPRIPAPFPGGRSGRGRPRATGRYRSRLPGLILLPVMLLFQWECRTPSNTNGGERSLPDSGVSRDLAARRASQVSDLRYRLSLDLSPGSDRVKGRQEIQLLLDAPDAGLALDFRDQGPDGSILDGTVSFLSVNGGAGMKPRQANGHILLPSGSLKAGKNTITIDYETRIAAANRPVTRYVDRDDGSEYIYSLFVPMDASLAFPCFDQPDLKARFTLDVTAPDGWTVVSNSDIEKTQESQSRRRTYFRETHPISTYLFAFAAGPFRRIEARGDTVPMKLYVRQSRLGRAREEAAEIIRITTDGMRFLSGFFARPFPFPKYDSVLIPGFAYGGMEHAGATFFREESLLFRTVPTESDKVGRATLLLHELAHQWFGDLVTMRWFDDLWLKEGFATYMAYRTLASLSEPGKVWKRFYESLKPAAYRIDATRGTTPIYQEVGNLKDAKSAYGAIVYSKAPGLLRYLSFVIGEESFRDGVRLFLEEHAFGNAEWKDLIGALERASNRSLGAWAEAWVRRRGMPRVDAEWSCDGSGKVIRLTLAQSDVLGEGGRWPVTTRLLLAYDGDASLTITARFDAAETEVPQAAGRRCPVYVVGNFEDYSYGQFPLDPRSRDAVIGRLGGVRDPFLRAMLWGALWDAVREADLPPQEFISLALRLLPAETDEELARSILARVTTAFRYYLSDSRRFALAPKLERLCYERMLNAAAQGMRITWFRAYRDLALTPPARAALKDLLAGKLAVPGVEIRPLDRWRLIASLLARGDAEAERLLRAERERDAGDDARKYAYVTEAARADPATKLRYFEDYMKNREAPEDWIEGSLESFNMWDHSELTFSYLGPALEALPAIKRERKIFFALAWLQAFLGGQHSREALHVVRAFLERGSIDRDLRLKVLEVADELERTVRIRAKFGG